MATQSTPVLILRPSTGFLRLHLRDLWEYRELLYFLVWRDIKVRYKQTALGAAWAILQPVMTMVVFSIFFGRLAKVPSDGVPYPIFAYVALLPWQLFAFSLTESSNSLVASQNLITKVYFPRLVIPIASVLAGLVDFAIAFVFLAALMVWYHIMPSWNVVFLPLLILLMMLTSAGIGMLLSALAIQYRDVRHAMGFTIQALMYAAPVVWPVSKLPPGIRLWYGLYPMAGVIEGFRASLLNTGPMPWDLIGMGSITATISFLVGALYFRRTERFFADVA